MNIRRSAIVALLAFFMAINFADKAIIGLAGSNMMADLNLTPAQFGMIGSGFFLLFSISGLLVGFLSDKVKSFYIILVMSSIWALSQLPIVYSGSFAVIMASRIILGAGEGPAFPIVLHAVFKWFPDDQRNLPTIFVQQGVNLGLTLAGPILTFFILAYGWKSAFLFLAISGAVWTVLWAMIGGEGPEQTKASSKPGMVALTAPLPRILLDATFLAVALIYFAEYVALAVYFTWLPTYLQKSLGYSQEASGWIFSGIAAIGIPATFLLGMLSTRVRQAGYSSRVARGLLLSITPALGGLAFMLLWLPFSPEMKVLLLAIGRVMSQTIFAFGPLLVAEICPSQQRGGIFGILSCVGTIGGFISPYIMGVLIQNSGSMSGGGFEDGYGYTGILLLFVGVVGILFVRPERTIVHLSQSRGAGVEPIVTPGL